MSVLATFINYVLRKKILLACAVYTSENDIDNDNDDHEDDNANGNAPDKNKSLCHDSINKARVELLGQFEFNRECV